MPAIRLTINGQPQTVNVDRLPSTPEELDEIVARAPGAAGATPPSGGQAPDQPPAPPDDSTWYERAGGYAKQKVLEFGDAAQRLGMDIASNRARAQAIAAGAPAPDPNRSWWDTGGDILTAGGTIVAPELTAAGTGVGAGLRAAGVSPETADVANAVTQLGLGGVEAYRAISAARKAGSAAAVVKSLAGEAPEAAPKLAGEALETAVPAAQREAAQGARAATYGPAKEVANLPGPPAPGTTGFVASAESPLGQRLYHGLTDLQQSHGEVMSRGERQATNAILDAITGGKTSAGEPITPDYNFLDKQLRISKLGRPGTPKTGGVSDLIEGSLNEMLKGTPAEGLREAGAEAWKPITATREALQKPIIRAARKADPITAFNVVGGSFTNPSKAILARDLLAENHPDVWAKVNQGFYGNIFSKAGGDATKAGAIWGKVDPGVKAVFDPDGIADQAFQRMAKWQKAGKGWSLAMKPLAAATAITTAVKTGELTPAVELLFAAHELPIASVAGKLAKGAEYGGPTFARGVASAAVPALRVYNAGPSGDPLLDAAEKASQGGGVESLTDPAAPAAAPAPADTGAERGPAYPSPAFREPGDTDGGMARLPDNSNVPIYRAPRGFVFHHSGGSSLNELVTTLQRRGLGSEYLMDRDGKIYAYGRPGSSHIEPNDRWRGNAPGLTNANSLGMEIVAKDDSDVTPAQIAAAKQFIAKNYPNVPVYGHGEVNPGHKQANEGMAAVNAIRADRGGRGPSESALAADTRSGTGGRYPREYGGGWDREIGAIAHVTGIPENLMRVVIHRESSGNPRALAPDGGRGLMQLMPATFRDYAPRIEAITGRPADIDDPIDNMVAGALHLRDDLDVTGGDLRRAAKRYNSGRADSMHPAVVDYGNDVVRRFAFLERQGRG